MRQVLFTIPIFGGVRVFGFGAMIVLAFISATWLACWRAKREKLDPEVILDMAFWVLFSGWSARGCSIATSTGDRRSRRSGTSSSTGKAASSTTEGSLAGRSRSSSTAAYRPFPLRPYMDVLAPSIAVGTLFGRLGCFLNGCCYGDACQLPWAVSFPEALASLAASREPAS